MKAENAKLNKEWCDHCRSFLKKKTAKKRRQLDKKITKKLLSE